MPISAAHDCSVGGIAVALARIAIAADVGARVEVIAPTRLASAAAFGERGGRVIVGVAPERAPALRSALEHAGVSGTRLGSAGGDELEARIGASVLRVPLDRLAGAWRTAF